MKVLEKTERRLGEGLFLKGERCNSPKCARVRRPYPPGQHGKSRKRGLSEYGVQLQEKQKIRFLYGIREKILERYFYQALADKKHRTGDALMNFLEKRLDNTVFRAGFAMSRSAARHLISYGHVLVAGRVMDQPSYLVRKGDVISIKPKSLENERLFGELPARLRKYEAPSWLKLDKENKTAEIISQPYELDLSVDPNIKFVIEYYSR